MESVSSSEETTEETISKEDRTISSSALLLGAFSLALAGVLFFFYPVLRPFSNEASLQGAQAVASPFWIVGHTLAAVGFILLALGLLSLRLALRQTAGERLGSVALVVTWIGAGPSLLYYGAESFALHAIGQQAVVLHSIQLLTLVNAIRWGLAIYVFTVGLVLIGVGPILSAIAIWRSGTISRWSGLPFALGFVLYIPQFFGSQPIRIAHGLLVALGCLWVAWSMAFATLFRSDERSL